MSKIIAQYSKPKKQHRYRVEYRWRNGGWRYLRTHRFAFTARIDAWSESRYSYCAESRVLDTKEN